MSTTGKINFHTFCALSFFSFGTAIMDYFLVYPSRAMVGEQEFIAYHSFLEAAILRVSVFPFIVMTIQNIFLFWSRPVMVENGLVVLSLCCLLLYWASSIVFQIPMNLQLNLGKDMAVIREVMDSNWGRLFFESLQVLSVLVMMIKGGMKD